MELIGTLLIQIIINSNILRIFYHNELYTILNSNGLLYFSLDLVNWDIR